MLPTSLTATKLRLLSTKLNPSGVGWIPSPFLGNERLWCEMMLRRYHQKAQNGHVSKNGNELDQRIEPKVLNNTDDSVVKDETAKKRVKKSKGDE